MREGGFLPLLGKCRVLALVLFVAVLAGCQQAPSGPQPLTEADKDQIGAVAENHMKAVLANDASAYAALFTEDGIDLPPNTEMRRGKGEIQEAAEAFFKEQKVTEFTNPLVEVYGMGDLAYGVGTYTATTEPVGGNGPATDKGKYVVVLKRQADGSWKWAAGIWNSDQAPAPPTPQE